MAFGAKVLQSLDPGARPEDEWRDRELWRSLAGCVSRIAERCRRDWTGLDWTVLMQNKGISSRYRLHPFSSPSSPSQSRDDERDIKSQ